jgi:predicted metal-dependent peptidase
MLNEPFLAAAVARLPLVDVTTAGWCPTMATDGHRIFVNMDFVDRMSDRDVEFVLAHELLHVVLGHVDRREKRPRHLWNLAIDYATNGLLHACGFSVPSNGLYNKSFTGLTAEQIYDALAQGGNRGFGRLMGLYGAEQGGNGHPGHSAGFDLHLDSADPEAGTGDVTSILTPLERQRLRRDLARDLSHHLHGRVAGQFESELVAARSEQVPWAALLARFVSGARRSDYRMHPPNRKHVWRGLHLPALGVPGPRHIAVAVDTSGSMSNDVLGRIFGEIDVLRSQFEATVTVLQCDARIHAIERFEPWDSLAGPEVGRVQHVFGRGGTSFVPIFEWLALEANGVEPPDILVYGTDTYGDFPAEWPVRPVVWIVPHREPVAVPFGEVVRMVGGA